MLLTGYQVCNTAIPPGQRVTLEGDVITGTYDKSKPALCCLCQCPTHCNLDVRMTAGAAESTKERRFTVGIIDDAEESRHLEVRCNLPELDLH